MITFELEVIYISISPIFHLVPPPQPCGDNPLLSHLTRTDIAPTSALADISHINFQLMCKGFTAVLRFHEKDHRSRLEPRHGV